ncbi:MAG: GHKL domain-containing protein, partial [Planctomycetes bacterium]|nr:GHKL domain-containing protein [Planctomycetota bacterium]
FRALADVARRVAAGHHEERVGRQAGVEATDVASAFNSMLETLAESRRQLANAAALAAVGQLSSSIVHEMRNPLSSIKLNLTALRQRVTDDPPHAELADIAIAQAGRVERMLNDLLEYGKPLELEPGPVSLTLIIDEALAMMASSGTEKNLSFETETDCERPAVSALVDRESVLRALGNLLLNAIQASPCGGTITIAVAADVRHGSRVLLKIHDQGPGIRKDLIDKIMEPFFTTREQGTGLGLANVRKIVECHGGTISAANAPQGGAEFTVSLPRASAEEGL